MATFSNLSIDNDGSQSSHEVSSRDLSILLSRLKQAILHPTQEDERRLRMSQFERARVETNLKFAQSALNKLEQGSAGRPVGKRTDTFSDLVAQREVLELLLDRLEDYKKLAADYDDDGSSEEDLLGEIIPTPSESQDSRRSSNVGGEEGLQDSESVAQAKTRMEPTVERPAATPSIDDPSPPPTSTAAIEGDATQTSHSLRARRSNTSPPPQSSSTAHSTARAVLFANRRNQNSQFATATTATTTATTEAILDQQRVEQDAILESIRRMAGALKQSSQNFSASLESDKDKLGAAGASMEKSELSMEAAKGRMGSLQRMTEGEGWWGRMMLYAWVYGLMVVLVLVVFVFPKLRF